MFGAAGRQLQRGLEGLFPPDLRNGDQRAAVKCGRVAQVRQSVKALATAAQAVQKPGYFPYRQRSEPLLQNLECGLREEPLRDAGGNGKEGNKSSQLGRTRGPQSA